MCIRDRESVLTSVIGKEDKLLIAANGAYGERMADIAEHAGMDYVIYNCLLYTSRCV